jgi:hypothetical protein
MRLFSRAEYARLRGVTAAMITKVAKKWAADAFVGNRINADHADPKAYLAAGGITETQISRSALGPTGSSKPKRQRSRVPTERRGRPPKKKAEPTASRPAEAPPPPPAHPDPPPLPTAPGFEDLDEIERKIQPLVLEFGTSRRLADWLDCVKTIQEIRAKKLANEQTQGKLIERELVRKVVFSALDSLALKLLMDAPPTLARELYALAKSGSAIEDAEFKIEKYIEQIFNPVKEASVRMLTDDAG